MYLLDTNVVSELRKPKPHGGVLAWFKEVDENHLFLSAVTLGEIQSGIELTRQQDPVKAQAIEHWLDQLAASYNILAMDAAAFRLWAKFMHQQPNTVYEDAMIAATAKAHKLTVVTRNLADFKRFDVALLNPFQTA